MRSIRERWSVLGCVAVVLLACVPAQAGRSFLESDDYRGGQEIVGVFLTDGDYAKMLADVVHLQGRLDWAWVVGLGDSPKLKSLGFSAEDYSSIVVQLPTDHTEEGHDWLPERAHEVLKLQCKRLGWTPGETGELLLATAIVDASDADGFGALRFFNASDTHLVEFEFRLTESGSGKTLLVAREQATSANMVGAVWRAASRLARFLAEPRPPRYAERGKSVALDLLEMPGTKKTHKFEKYCEPRQIIHGALSSSGIFERVAEDPSDTDYGLEVRISEANVVGAYQTTINLLARYTLKDRASGETVAQEEIASSTTMSAAEIRSGGKRLTAATSAAFLDNIDNFLFRLDGSLDSPESP